MKAILLSVQPKWLEKILNGEKTIEVRATLPKDRTVPVYIYCTKSKPKLARQLANTLEDKPRFYLSNNIFKGREWNGKVVAKFRIGGVMCAESPLLLRQSCLTPEELYSYAKGKRIYGWRISDLQIFNEPMSLGGFSSYCKTYMVFDGADICIENCPKATKTSDWQCDRFKPLTRPPQSWQYVEVENE